MFFNPFSIGQAAYNAYTAQGSRNGSWGTPELGITEKIGNLFGSPTASSGGSNIVPNKPLLSPVPQNSGNKQALNPQVLPYTTETPSNTGGTAPKNPFNGSNLGTPTPTNTGGNGSPVVDAFRQGDADVQGRFSDFINSLGDQRSELEGIARQSADSQKAGINASLNTALTRFPQYQQQVNQNSDQALKQLAQRGQAYQMAANNRLGLAGAGDSSAAGMYDYALGKAQSRMESDVYRDRNNQLSEIQMAEEETRRRAEEEINGIDQWLNSQINTIAQQIQGLQNSLRSQSIDTRRQTYDQYMSYLAGLEQQANAYRMQVQQNVQNRLQSLNDAKLQLSQSSQFDPRQIVAGEINAMPAAMQQAQMNFVNPYFLRDEDRRLF